MANIIDLSLSSDEGSPSRAEPQEMSKTTNAPPIHSVRSEKHEDPFNDLGDFDIPLPPRKRRRSDKSGSWEEADSLVDSEVSGVTPSNRDFTGLARSKAASPLQRHHSSPRGDSQYLSISASSDGSVIGDRSEPSSPLKRVAVDLSVTTAALLAELSSGAPSRHTLQGTDQPKQRRKSKKGKQNGTQRSKTPDETGEPNAAQQTALSKAEKAQAKEEEKQRRQAERKAATEERKAQKEAEKARKQLAKEEKEREKKKDKEEALELAAANRARWDKSISITEMAVDLPASIDGKEIGKAIRAALKSSNIEASTYNSILPDIIRFRRKVSSRFNEELGYWEPAPESVNVEKQVVCLISGQHLLSMAIAADADEGLDAYVGMVRAKYPDFRVTCLVEGLDQVVKDARKASSRAYEASVRRQGQPSAAEGDTSRAQTGTLQKQLAPDEIKGKVDEALLELQVAHWCLIHQTETPADTADFVATLTEQMSTIPYKSRMNAEATFCMDSGQIRCGDDEKDTFVKMLQQVTRVTPSMAVGIVSVYPSVGALVRAFEKEGPLILEDVMKEVNRDGSRSDARVGPATSKRLHKVFMSNESGTVEV